MLQPGQTAPTFSLPDADMQAISLSAFKGKQHVVLFFYARDDAPGCTIQAIDFSDHDEQFARHSCIVLGVSPDDCLSHAAFRDKHGLSVNLLSDVEGEVCRKYGVVQKREVDGVKREGVVRSTFVIDKKGVIRHAEYGVTPRGHAAEIYDVVRKLRA